MPTLLSEISPTAGQSSCLLNNRTLDNIVLPQDEVLSFTCSLESDFWNTEGLCIAKKLEYQHLPKKKILTLGPASRRNTKHLLCCKYQQIVAQTPEQKISDKKRVWTNDPSLVTLQHLPGLQVLGPGKLCSAGWLRESSQNCKVGQIPSNQKFQLQIQCWLKKLEFTK